MYRRSLFDNLVVTDLEGALFQSKSANPKGLHPMFEASNGRVEGWATEEQAQRWDTLRYEAFCVGYTSFSEPQVSRVTGWDPLHEHQLMLADHGMTLLYRDLSGQNRWEVIEDWSRPYLDKARANAKVLQYDGARLYFEIMKHLPELVQHQGKMLYPKLPMPSGSVEGMYYVIQANGFLQAMAREGRLERVIRFKELLAEHLEWCEGRYNYFEWEGTYAFVPAWASRSEVLNRFFAVVQGRETQLDTRLAKALRDIGVPKVVLAEQRAEQTPLPVEATAKHIA